MKIEVFPDAESVARESAKLIAEEARTAVALRGKFVMAVSGGKTPWIMLRNLGHEDVPWNAVHVVQVDERIAPPGDPDRNLTHLRESLLTQVLLRPDQILAMPVESQDLEAACTRQWEELIEIRREKRTYEIVSEKAAERELATALRRSRSEIDDLLQRVNRTP